jgi:hypothetical protein
MEPMKDGFREAASGGRVVDRVVDGRKVDGRWTGGRWEVDGRWKGGGKVESSRDWISKCKLPSPYLH